jgi:lipopolysaccharide export system protein LptA
MSSPKRTVAPAARAFALASAFAFAFAFATLAPANLRAEGQDTDEPLQMTADRLDLDIEAKTALLAGHVTLRRGPMTLSCPRVDVRYDRVPHVTWARGSGGVVAEVKGVRAEAPEVEVDLASRTMDLRGGVRLARGDGWITADRATINIATGKVSMAEVKGSLPIPKPAP